MRDDLKRSDPALAAALDRFTVPDLPDGFADRVAARAVSRTAAPALPDFRARRRSGWSRGRSALIGIAAFGLVSAAAAATGVFGPISRDTPVLGPIMASVAPSVIAKPVHRPKAQPKPAAPTPQRAIIAPDAVDDSKGDIAVDPVQLRAAAIADRLERRAERRAAIGLPPKPVARRKIRQALKDLSPQERKAVIEQVRELRRLKRAAPGETIDPADPGVRLSIAERPRVLTPEQLARINARRASRGRPPLPMPSTSQAAPAQPIQ